MQNNDNIHENPEIQRLIEFKTDSKHAHFMLLTRSCVLDRIMELELIRIEMIKSSESVINHYQNPHKMPLRGHLALQVI